MKKFLALLLLLLLGGCAYMPAESAAESFECMDTFMYIEIRGDGTPCRSYLYADDLVEWLFAVLERGQTARPYNVGSAKSVSIRELAETVRATLGGAREVRVLSEPKPGPATVYVPVVARACAGLGVRETVGLEDAILRSAGRLPAA